MANSKNGTAQSPDFRKSEAQLINELEDLRRQLATQQVVALERIEALAREKEQLSITLDSMGDAVITTDNQARVVLFNPVAEKLTGWSQVEVFGRILEDVFHIVDEHTGVTIENPVMKVLESGNVEELPNNCVLIARDGTSYIITDSTAPIHNPTSGEISGVVFIFRDITHQKQLEQELIKAQKLESIGVLAGGIAHDFNNILMALTSNLWLARAELQASLKADNANLVANRQRAEANTNVLELLAEAEAAAFRAKGLTGQLLTFAKGGVPIKKNFSPSLLLQETVKFALRGSNVRVAFNLPDDLWWVEADSGQLGQVITNLVINAEQSMPNGGTLRISAKNISADEISQQIQLLSVPLKKIDYIKVSIEDHGTGISDQILPKIFDPYFSTKQKGNGLGLATAYSIIARHEGVLTVLSKMNKGSTFMIYLPAIKSIQPVQPPVNLPETENVTARTERLLVMDDEKTILTILRRILTNVGYRVDMAEEGASAIELYQKALLEGQPYKIVILDLTIPGGMGGIETIARLRQIDPKVTAIVMSGYNDSGALSEYQEYGFVSTMFKPFKVKELYQTIENVLLSS